MNSVIETVVYLSVAAFAVFGIIMLFYHALFDTRRYRGILLREGEGKKELEGRLCNMTDRTGEYCTENFFVLIPETEIENTELAEYIAKLGIDCVYYQESDGR